MTRVVLFNSQSANVDSPTFEIKGQRTFMSTGMQPGDVMTFEIVKVAPGARSFVCGCRISELGIGTIEGVQELQCPSCEEATLRPVRMTPQNPVVVLDFPQGVIMRAIYSGDGLEQRTVTVWSEESTTRDLTPELRGCPPIFVTEEDMVWEDTGNFRCVTGGIGVEYEQTNDCGRRRWEPSLTRTQEWIDTANLRCVDDGIGVEVEQINQCGDRRWEPSLTRTQEWIDTANLRCVDDGIGVEVEQINQCGDRRWEPSLTRTQEWVANGVHRCTPTGDVELQETNQCGDRRWTVCGSVEWIDTGKTRCGETNVENEQTNQCGHRRWFVTAIPLTWVATGTTRCGETNFEVQEVNNCGTERWTEAGLLTWTPTGATRCASENFETQESNNCGGTRWTVTGPNVWTPTGVTSCVSGTVRNQESDLCGNLRTVNTGTPCGDSGHFVSTVTRSPLSAQEGSTFCWTVTLTSPVVGSPLTLTGALSGTEQDEHSYAFPSMTIPVGQSSGQMCVTTVTDLFNTPALNLCLQIQPNARLSGIPAALCVTVTEGAGNPTFSQHTLLSVTPTLASITEGANACWDVTLNSPVTGANLPINFSLSGSEQTIHGYSAPSLVIPIGASSGQVCVATTDDTVDEPDRLLGLTALTSGRVLNSPATANVTVLDNDEPVPGESSHTVISVVPSPTSGPEGTTFNWTVTLNAPVTTANLSVVSVLTGAEQGIHNYVAPTGIIPIGSSSVVLSVVTTDDTTREPTRDLALQLLTSTRITAVPAAASVNVLDNDPITPPIDISGENGGNLGDNCYSTVTPGFQVFVNFSIDGTITTGSSESFFSITTSWLPPGGNTAEYEIRVDDSTLIGALPGSFARSGSAVNTWLNAATFRGFIWTQNVSGTFSTAATVNTTLSIRRITSGGADTSVAFSGVLVSYRQECP